MIADRSGVRAAYETGTGAIVVRARSHIEGDAIVVTEQPCMVDRGGDYGVFRQIADGFSAGTLRDVDDLEDESDWGGMRLVIRLRPGADPGAAEKALLAHKSLQTTFATDLVALVHGMPGRLTLRELIGHFLAGRDTETVRRDLSHIANRFGDERRTSLSPTA